MTSSKHRISKNAAFSHGQLLVNFVNAPTTDEAIFALLEDMEKAFGFSQGFARRVKEEFPSWVAFHDSLRRKERILAKLVPLKEKTREYIARQFYRLGRELTGYDSNQETLILREFELGYDKEHGITTHVYLSPPCEVGLKEIEKMHFSQHMQKTMTEIRRLLVVGGIIQKLSKGLTESDIFKIKENVHMYRQMRKYHRRIKEKQIKTSLDLEYLITTESLFSNKYFHGLCAHCSGELGISKFTLNEDDSITSEHEFFSEADYFKQFTARLLPFPFIPEGNKLNQVTIPPCEKVIPISLFEFLRHGGRDRLKKCPYCQKFFIADDSKRKTRCYDEECEKAYNRDRKRKQREEDPIKYYTK